MLEPWIGVDLDGTLAEYHGWHGPADIGQPIRPMVVRVMQWLQEGKNVRVFTARVADLTQASTATEAIEAWCERYLGQKLPVTCVKDYGMVELWDDRCVQIETNTGHRIDELD